MDEQSFQVFLSSSNCDRQGANNSDCTFFLPTIQLASGHHIWLSVQSACLPISFYNINNNNNKLVYSLSNNEIPQTILITPGNYNVITFTTLLNTLLNSLGFTIVYLKATNKLQFTHSVYNFTFYTALSTCFSLMGFSLINQISINRLLVSDYVINLAPIRAFQINIPHIITGNISKTKNLCQTVLCQIPITQQPHGIVTYFNSTQFSSNLFVNFLYEIQVQILDQNSVLLDLNGVEWNLVLQFDIIKFI